MNIQPGSIVADKYQIIRQIGKGGMSRVFLAVDLHLNKQWAIKEIRKTANTKNNEIIESSLVAEANLMKNLDYPALPRIVDIIDDGQTLCVVMDYVEGESLDKILKQYGRQSEEDVINWGIQLCGTLDYLHSHNIIYRDMKPANIMVNSEGNVKVIDFGIAREYKEDGLSDTVIMGTPGYAPPEQYDRNRQTDARSDIYALGMTLHHLVTGIDPRSSDYHYQPARKIVPTLSEGIEAIINKCVQSNPEDRYQNCVEMIYDLQHPDLITKAFRERLKKRLRLFVVLAAMTAFFLLGGIGTRIASSQALRSSYNDLIGTDVNSEYDMKVENYTAAIDLIGNEPGAYILLLDAYRDNGLFGDRESNQFLALFNANQASMNTQTDAFLDLNYEAGITYFYLYSGNDQSFRTRVLRAFPFFTRIVESGRTDYPYFSIAQSYYIIGDFYSRYIVDATSIREPTKESYESLLDSLRQCMENMDEYEYDDAAYISLTMFREIIHLLNDHRRGLVSTGVDQKSVMEILDTAYNRTETISVTQEASLVIKEAVEESYASCSENIERAYTNSQGRE